MIHFLIWVCPPWTVSQCFPLRILAYGGWVVHRHFSFWATGEVWLLPFLNLRHILSFSLFKVLLSFWCFPFMLVAAPILLPSLATTWIDFTCPWNRMDPWKLCAAIVGYWFLSMMLCFRLHSVFFFSFNVDFRSLHIALCTYSHWVFFCATCFNCFFQLYWSMIENQKLYIFRLHNVIFKE